MGIDICYFLDHDLSLNNHERLCEELRKRVNDKEVIFHDCDTEQAEYSGPKMNVWHVNFYKADKSILFDDEIHLFFNNGTFDCTIELYKGAAFLVDLNIDGENPFNYLRWNHMIDLFRDEAEKGKEWKNLLLNVCNQYIVPILHSKKILLTADSSSFRHETLGGEYLMEKNMTIEEALEMNNSFSSPCKVWRNEEAFGRAQEDYWDDGDDFIGSFFIFDFPAPGSITKLPS